MTKLESKSTDYKGLNLTRAVIDGQMKYKQTMSENPDKFVYTDDLDIVRWASQEAIESVKGVGPSSRSFECEIMEWADDVAYAVHDLEDSIHAHYVDRSLLNPTNDKTQAAIADVQECFSDLDLHQIHACLSTFITDFIGEWNDPRRASVTLEEQKAHRKQLTSALIGRYMDSPRRVERGSVVAKPVSERYLYTVDVPPESQAEVMLLHRLVRNFVIASSQLRTLEAKGQHVVRSLFLKFVRGDNPDLLLPDDWKEYLRHNQRSKEWVARVVSDYIAGMTDSYAQKMYSRLFLPNQGSIYEVM